MIVKRYVAVFFSRHVSKTINHLNFNIPIIHSQEEWTRSGQYTMNKSMNE